MVEIPNGLSVNPPIITPIVPPSNQNIDASIANRKVECRDQKNVKKINAEYNFNFTFYNKIKETSIFIDLKKLRYNLKLSQMLMVKENRILFAMPALESCTRCIQLYENAYADEKNRESLLIELANMFIVLRLDIEDIMTFNAIVKNDPKHDLTARGIKAEIIRLTGTLDDSIDKFLRYTRNKNKASSNTSSQ